MRGSREKPAFGEGSYVECIDGYRHTGVTEGQTYKVEKIFNSREGAPASWFAMLEGVHDRVSCIRLEPAKLTNEQRVAIRMAKMEVDVG